MAGLDSSRLGYRSMLSRSGTADSGRLGGPPRSPCGRLAGDPSDVRLRLRTRLRPLTEHGRVHGLSSMLVSCKPGAGGMRATPESHVSGWSAVQ